MGFDFKATGKEPSHVIRHGGVALYDVHDAVALGVLPAPKVTLIRGWGREVVVFVHGDCVRAAASLRGISGASKLAGGIAEFFGFVGDAPAKALRERAKQEQ